MKVTYKHYRLPAPNQIPRPDTEQFQGRHGWAFHYQRGVTPWEPRPRGGYTVCTVYDSEGVEVVSGVAECSPLDSFNYRLGREIAKGRLLKNLFTRYADDVAYTVFVGLGWTSARSLGEFRKIHAALYRRYEDPTCYFLKGGVLVPPSTPGSLMISEPQ